MSGSVSSSPLPLREAELPRYSVGMDAACQQSALRALDTVELPPHPRLVDRRYTKSACGGEHWDLDAAPSFACEFADFTGMQSIRGSVSRSSPAPAFSPARPRRPAAKSPTVGRSRGGFQRNHRATKGGVRPCLFWFNELATPGARCDSKVTLVYDEQVPVWRPFRRLFPDEKSSISLMTQLRTKSRAGLSQTRFSSPRYLKPKENVGTVN